MLGNAVVTMFSDETNPYAARSPPQAVQLYLDKEEKFSVTVVDTPGFDDTWRTDAEVVAEITEYMAAQYALKIPLRGIIYLHQIHENRMKGSGRRYVDMFRAMCGDDALHKVTLVTTRWDCVAAEQRGEARRREQELIDTWWKPMLRLGSTVTQFHGSRSEAEAMVLEIVRERASVVLDIQRDVVDRGKEVAETVVGASLDRKLEEDIAGYEKELRELGEKAADALRRGRKDEVRALKDQQQAAESAIKGLQESRRKIRVKVGASMAEKIHNQGIRWKEKIPGSTIASGASIFAAILNVTLVVVKFVALGGVI